MSAAAPHLFADISAHGFGHLAQAAPVLNALAQTREFRLTVRCGLPHAQLAGRLVMPFTHIAAASDFGFVMRDALTVDVPASGARYRAEYADWPGRVAAEARLLAELDIDLVLSDVSPLPLAGAARAGIPAVGMCSLNWADLFFYFFGVNAAWAAPIYAAMHAAYAGAQHFLLFTPGMDMPDLPNVTPIGPVSTSASLSRAEVATALQLPAEKRWLLLALGGIAHRLPVEHWPALDGVQLLVPLAWRDPGLDGRTDISYFDAQRLPFSELLPHADAVLTKPGYGTFAEAACNGVPVLYLRRADWPEEPYLIRWLHAHASALELSAVAAGSGDLGPYLAALWAQRPPPRPPATGIADAVRILAPMLPAR